MSNATEDLLRLLQDSELSLSPMNIAWNTGYSGNYIRQLCKDLWEEGLLEREEKGTQPYYSITDRGRAYLAGELDDGALGNG